MYEFKSRVRFSELDKTAHLSVTGMINYFQDTCTMLSEDIGRGVEFLLARDLGWFIISWQIEVVEMPLHTTSIVIKTECNTEGLYSARNFYMEDENGKLLVKAHSIWSMVNLVSRMPIRIPEEVISVYEKVPELKPNKLNRKIKTPNEMEKRDVFMVTEEFLDTNGHMNNARYVQLSEKYLPLGFPLKTMRVEYRTEVKKGEELHMLVSENAGEIIVSLANAEGKPYAIVEYKS